MNKCYVVYGTTGEWEDYSVWNVCVYPRRSSAEAHARKANEWCQENGCASRRSSWDEDSPKNPFDSKMQVDYTGTRYGVTPIPFKARI